MFELVISDEKTMDLRFLALILKKEVAQCKGICVCDVFADRNRIVAAVPEKFEQYFLARVREEVANFIAVEHKYRYFLNNLPMPILDDFNKSAFCSALAVFDKETDKKYCLEHLKFFDEINIDSAIAFCMPLLFERWNEIIELVKSNFVELSLSGGAVEMMKFLIRSSGVESSRIVVEKNLGCRIRNESGDVLFDFDEENESRLIHALVCLLPKEVVVVGKNTFRIDEVFDDRIRVVDENKIDLVK